MATTKKESEKFVDADEYLAMALSNRKLERDDKPAAGICALVDATTGERYMIHQKHLMEASIGQREPRKVVR